MRRRTERAQEREDLRDMGEAGEEVARGARHCCRARRGGAYDLISIGEAMLRFTPPNGLRIEQTLSFDLAVGGAELNVAVAMSRIGARTAWLSKLPELAARPDHRQSGARPRRGHQPYHLDGRREISRLGTLLSRNRRRARAGEIATTARNSAASTMRPDDWDWPALLAQTRVFHVSGITPALSASCREMTFAAVRGREGGGLRRRVRHQLPRETLVARGSRRVPARTAAAGGHHPHRRQRSEDHLRCDGEARRTGAVAAGGVRRAGRERRQAARQRGERDAGAAERRARPSAASSPARARSSSRSTQSARAMPTRAGFLYGLLTTDDEEQAVTIR